MPDFNNTDLGSATADEKDRGFNSQEIPNTLWAMAETGTYLPEVFETLCAAASEKVQDFNSPEIVNTLWVRCNAPEVFEALSVAAGVKFKSSTRKRSSTLLQLRSGGR